MTKPDLSSQNALPTPALLLDEAKMMRNIARLAERAKSLGVSPSRPHAA